MKTSELSSMTVEELTKKEQELRRELFNLRFQKATGEIENPMRIRAVRKDLTRVLTIKSEKSKGKNV